ncbi:MAG TPA: hypothetical protein VIC85_12090 [Ktedonobacterales bacterium]
MRSLPLRVYAHAIAVPVALTLTLSVAGCGAAATQKSPKPTATPAATATPVPHATVTEVSTTHHFADSKSGGTVGPCANGDPIIQDNCGVTVTTTCPNGEPVISGGYTVDDPLAYVSSSYPSGASAWTITAHDEGQDGGSHPVTVTAYADCLQANFAATIQNVTSTPNIAAGNSQTVTVSCPQGTSATGGGYRGSYTGPLSIPSGNGWQAALRVQTGNTAQPVVFAMCAANHVAAASTPSAAKTFKPGDTNGEITVACPQGQLLVGGGAKVDREAFILTVAATNDASHWHVVVDGPNSFESGPGVTATATAYAVCVSVQ